MKQLTPAEFLREFDQIRRIERRWRIFDWAFGAFSVAAIAVNVWLVGAGGIWWLSLAAALYCGLALRGLILRAIARRHAFALLDDCARYARYTCLPDLRSV